VVLGDVLPEQLTSPQHELFKLLLPSVRRVYILL